MKNEGRSHHVSFWQSNIEDEHEVQCVWVETDTGCGFRQKQVATYTVIYPKDTQTKKTNKKESREKSAVISLDDI